MWRSFLSFQTTLTSASQYLFSALDSRAFLRSATVLLPPAWPDSCVATSVLSASGESSDVTILPSDPARGDLWTQQSLGCGQQGDQIYLGFERLLKEDNVLGKKIIETRRYTVHLLMQTKWTKVVSVNKLIDGVMSNNKVTRIQFNYDKSIYVITGFEKGV